LGCWIWFNGVLKEAEVSITGANKSKIDQIMHKYVSEQPAMDAAQQTGEKPAKKSTKVARALYKMKHSYFT
jgi:hypothetical protein